MVGERDEDVAVSPAQAVGASAVGGDEFGLAQPAQGEGGGRVGAQRGVTRAAASGSGRGPQRARRLQPGQLRLGHPGRGAHQGQALRGGDVRTTGDVHQAQDLLCRRIVDRCCRAGPGLHQAVEMLL